MFALVLRASFRIGAKGAHRKRAIEEHGAGRQLGGEPGVRRRRKREQALLRLGRDRQLLHELRGATGGLPETGPVLAELRARLDGAAP